MRHRNGFRQLGRSHAHRKAMYANMLTALFLHERIITTKQKAKELKSISERMITRAKRNLGLADDAVSQKIHNMRIVSKTIKDKDIVQKLFADIALRFKERNGGYTRLFLLGRRPGDAAEMAIIELVDKKAKVVIEPDDKGKKTSKEKKEKKSNKNESKES